jgi:hypothetical protein
MKIIKIINENNCKLLQILNKYISVVNKVIEIKENELISISMDNTFKIVILNNKK